MPFVCPNCGNDGTEASIDITLTVNVVYNGPEIGLGNDPFEFLPGDPCRCSGCGHEADVGAFTPRE